MLGMLTFLAPAALIGSLLLAIPILVHIFKPRKMRQTPFSSLRWLRMTQQRLSRRIQWHQMLLFLLRVAFITLLVLALAQPLLGPGTEARHTDRYVIVDVSRSMACQVPGRPSPLERAKQVAAQIVSQGRTGDRTALLLTGSRTKLLTPPTFNAQTHLPQIEATPAGATDTNLSSALAVIRPLLAHSQADADVELHFLTDNHQQSWNQGEVAAFTKELPVPVRVQVVDVGIAGAQNGWIAGARLLHFTEPSRRVVRVEARCVGDTRQERTVRVAGLAGMAEQSQAITIEPNSLTQVDFDIPPGYDLRGQIAEITLDPADALPSDDRYFLSLDAAAALHVLLVEHEAASRRLGEQGLHLRTAVDSLTAKTNQAIELVSRSSAAVTDKDMTAADIIVLAGVPELADAPLAALEKRVKAGAGLVVFLGAAVQPEFYNAKLHKPLQPADGLMPVPLNVVKARDHAQGEPMAALTNIRWSHPLLAPLNDPKLGDLGRSRFNSYYRFAAVPPENDVVLAWFDDQVPAVLEHGVGVGKVILFNTSANDQWGDLARRQSYVPLVDRLLAYLSGGGVRRNFEVGDVVTLPLDDLRSGEKIQVLAPSGAKLTPTLASAGGRAQLRLDNVSEPGIYRVERAGPAQGFAFAVNVGRGDSMLTPMDTEVLAKWWEPLAFEVVGAEAATQRLGKTGSLLALAPWLIALAAGLLLAEMFFVHWLCPRANPTVAEAIVHRRGLLRPMTTKES
jgi:hypothetical protein